MSKPKLLTATKCTRPTMERKMRKMARGKAHISISYVGEVPRHTKFVLQKRRQNSFLKTQLPAATLARSKGVPVLHRVLTVGPTRFTTPPALHALTYCAAVRNRRCRREVVRTYCGVAVGYHQQTRPSPHGGKPKTTKPRTWS
jgi:hypothetical protein